MGQYLAQIKIQIVKQIGCADAALGYRVMSREMRCHLHNIYEFDGDKRFTMFMNLMVVNPSVQIN